MSENWLIVGATSGIGRALCQVMAKRGCRLVVTGRQAGPIDALAAELKGQATTDVFPLAFDVVDYDQHAPLVAKSVELLGGTLDGAVLCQGVLLDQVEAQRNAGVLRQSIEVNFTATAALLERVAEVLERQGHGALAAVSSVAGDCGRQSNYTYGAAKAGLSAYLQGMRNRLFYRGVHVLTIKPGFVDTPMIAGRVNPRSPLVASPQRVAADIDRALRRRKNVLYTPWFWRIILTVICSLPEAIFKRLKF